MLFSKNFNKTVVLFGRVCLVVSCFVFGMSIYRLLHPVVTKFSVTAGQVLEDSTPVTVCSENINRGPRCQTEPLVKYSYLVGGKKYSATHMGPIVTAEDMNDNKIYRTGESVLVYFQNLNPAVSSLNPYKQNNYILYFLIIFSILFMIAGVIAEIKRKRE